MIRVVQEQNTEYFNMHEVEQLKRPILTDPTFPTHLLSTLTDINIMKPYITHRILCRRLYRFFFNIHLKHIEKCETLVTFDIMSLITILSMI